MGLPSPRSIVAGWVVSVKDLTGALVCTATSEVIGVASALGVPIGMVLMSIPLMSMPDELILILSGVVERRAATKITPLPNSKILPRLTQPNVTTSVMNRLNFFPPLAHHSH